VAVTAETPVPRDRDVLALALPALGALAAEPLYVLGDTAVVGHLGTLPLAGLALGGLLLAELLGFCTFLEYGTTARAARLVGAEQPVEALDVGVQATWLALGLGVLLLLAIELLAAPALHLLAGGATPAAAEGLRWLRIAALGSPLVLATAAAQGWLRAFGDTRTPLLVLAVANAASVALSAALVLGAGLGIEGSALANLAAQTAAGLAFLVLLRRRTTALRPSWRRMRSQFAAARDLTVRTTAFFAAFTVATGVAARMGDAQVAAHQIGIQLWVLLALVLDSIAIAAQSLIGRLLGAGSVAASRALARRLLLGGLLLGCALALAFAAARDVVPRLFTSDPLVLRQVAVLWPYFVAQLPVAGCLFALDGVLFGAGDLRFMRNVTVVAALGAFLPLTLATALLGLGLGGLWLGLSAFLWVRLAFGLRRYRGGRWLVAGSALADAA
jgi:putative MATE family efflux protein